MFLPAQPALLILLTVASLGHAGEVAGDASPLLAAPQAVQTTIAKKFAQATIESCTGAAASWTVKLTDAKHEHHTLLFTVDGVLLKDNGNDPAATRRRGGRSRVAK